MNSVVDGHRTHVESGRSSCRSLGIQTRVKKCLIATSSPPGSCTAFAHLLQEDGSQGGSCEISYRFEARLHRPGMLHFDAKGKAKLNVLSRPQGGGPPAPVLVGPDTQTVKKCCCLKRGR